MKHPWTLTPSLLFLGVTTAAAQPKPIADYLASMDGTEVSFAGLMMYDDPKDSFTFYDEKRERFPVTMDTGREAREQVEESCLIATFGGYSYEDLCQVSGTGSVEVRGSEIHISVETIKILTQAVAQ